MAAKKTKKPQKHKATKHHIVKPPKRYAYLVLVTGASDKEVMIEAARLQSLLEMKRVRFLSSQWSLGMRGPVDRLAKDFVAYLRREAAGDPAMTAVCDAIERNISS